MSTLRMNRVVVTCVFLALAGCSHSLHAGDVGSYGTLALVPDCQGDECGQHAARGIRIVLPNNFDPAQPQARLRVFDSDPNGDGNDNNDWRNTPYPTAGHKVSPLDVNLSGIWGAQMPTARRFAFVSIKINDQNFYFDQSNAVVALNSDGRRYIRNVKVRPNGNLVFKVKLLPESNGKLLDYKLTVMKRVSGQLDQPVPIDPKVRNGGF